MASSERCPHCGALVLPQEKFCTQCGAQLQAEALVTDQGGEPRLVVEPRTIEELKAYCAANGMPLEKMRFFIGIDYRQPRAFGIYRDGDSFVVYKNKSDGSRAVRYHGPDEAYAVKELFEKLLSECHARGIYPDEKPEQAERRRRAMRRKRLILVLVILAGMLFTAGTLYMSIREHKHDGYYRYSDDAYYYRYGSAWYYDDDYDWVMVDDFPYDDYEDYYLGEDYDSAWSVDNFESSSAWAQIQEERHTNSSDYSSWDSGDTNWDSDW